MYPVTGTPHGSNAIDDPAEAAAHVILNNLHAILKAGGMYAPGHTQHVQLARRLGSSLEPFFRTLGTDEIRVLFIGDRVVVNDVALRPDERILDKLLFVTEAARACSLVELRLRIATAEFDICAFAERFVAASRAPQEFGTVSRPTVEAFSPRYSDEHVELLGSVEVLPRFGSLTLYAEIAAALRHWDAERGAGGAPPPSATRRAAARLIEAFDRDASALLGLPMMRPLLDDTALHRLDTAIFALALAQNLEFDRQSLLELVATAFARPGYEPRRAWWARPVIAPHEAAELAFRGATPLEILTTFESCAPTSPVVDPDFYGRPVRAHVATAILSIASALVDLLDPGEASNPFSGEMALQLLLAQGGPYFDETLVSALVRALGTWPPGTIVRLNSGDLAVVVARPNAGAPLGRPSVRLIELDSGAAHDLARPELAAYEIVQSVQRGECSVNPYFVFLAGG